MKRLCISIGLLILLINNLQSRPANFSANFAKSKLVNTEIDTSRLLSDKPIKSPMGALLRSAILPGLGQIYNKKYIKGIFVFALNGTLGYQIYNFNKKWNDTGTSRYRDKRNLYTWYFGVSYFLTLVDAYIDAYLFGFDKAVEIGAVTLKDSKRNTIGLNFKFNL